LLSPPFPLRFGARGGSSGHAESERRLDASSLAKSSLVADPLVDQRAGLAAGGVAAPACDFCGAAYPKGQRRRLLWQTEGGDQLVLADLCARCASHADRLLEVYGGRGRASMRVTGPATTDAIPVALVRRASGVLLRGAVYVLIALVTFFVVTLIISRD
jgi:hypothetical protein